jgi:ABC-type tungstate transport system substrate-binding protein
LFGYPYAASVIWIPLGIASLILVIIALARRERARRWAIALLVANVLSLPLVLVLWFVFLL